MVDIARRVRGDSLAETVGHLLTLERLRAGLSQTVLAHRLGTSQQWLSKVERGAANVRLHSVQRILAELGRQLMVEAVPLGRLGGSQARRQWSDLDVEMDRNLALGDEDRAWNVEQFGPLLARLEGAPFAITGHVAAFALDPREPGAMRWLIYAGEVRVKVVPELPLRIGVRFGERTLPVVPLTTIEQEDPWLGRVGVRWRRRGAGRGTA